jgi:branched-chain amino acid transport system substrate-binding protein
MGKETMKFTRVRGTSALAIAAAVTVIGVSACSSSSSGSASSAGQAAATGSLPAQIPVTVLADETGEGAFYGTQLIAGINAGTKAVEDQGILKGSKISVTVEDTGTNAATASTLVSKAANSKAVAVIGPSVSFEVLAIAPVAQRAGIPLLVDSSGDGALTSADPYVWSLTTPEQSQISPIVANMTKSGIKTVAVIYANDIPTDVQINSQLKSTFAASGLKFAADISTSITATDFSAAATKAVQSGADATLTLGGGPMMPSVAKALTSAGFKGIQYGNSGADGNMATLGSAANGYLYSTENAQGQTDAASMEFETMFAAVNPGVTPYYPGLDGYNSVLFLAKAIALANSTSRSAILGALNSVAASGFDGAGGKVAFSSRQLSLGAVLVKMENGKPVAVPSAS